ncbi:hypothetical protein ACSX1C_00300 [Pseudomonas sp. MBLB4123]|uniref:hypothetical protein n=1 Tax=Pseudomonas sp. MBLB4123 TaxID=3451557 RepID=UPI003F751569
MQYDIQKSKKAVSDLILKKYNPEKWEEEQAKKKKELDDLLLYVEGIKDALALQEKEESEGILFKSDSSSSRGFKPNK